MDKEFITNDLQLTSFLLTQGIQLLATIKTSNTQFSFRLSNPERCYQLKQQYMNKASAPAVDLFVSRDMLVNEINNLRKAENIR
jgi:hypothetical protein